MNDKLDDLLNFIDWCTTRPTDSLQSQFTRIISILEATACLDKMGADKHFRSCLAQRARAELELLPNGEPV